MMAITPTLAKSMPLFSGKKLSETLTILLEEAKVTMAQLHKNTGVPLTTIKRLKNNGNANPTVNSLLPIADFFSISLNQLLGIDPLPHHRPIGVYAEKRGLWTAVPMISWQQVSQWPNMSMDPKTIRTLSVDLELSPHCFALIIEENNWHHFLPGTMLIFDPNKLPTHRSYVLVENKEQVASFYQLLMHDGTRYLKHPCPDYKTVICDPDYTIKATLVQARMEP